MNKISTTKKTITSPTKNQMKQELNNAEEFPFEPGINVINNILNYSKALSIRKSKNLNHFEIVLN